MAGEELQPPRPLPWYPRKLAWQMDASRAQLRKLDALAAVRMRSHEDEQSWYGRPQGLSAACGRVWVQQLASIKTTRFSEQCV